LSFFSRFDQFYLKIKANRWYWLFAIFCRVSLAIGFLIAGMVKVMGERFASGLSPIHPMGSYLEALHHTGYYYTFIGVAQVLAAIFLLIPRTALIGALLYFPMIVNIWVLSFAVRFEGSFISSPLMVLANTFLLVWYYDRLQYILPFKKSHSFGILKKPTKYSLKFPWKFFTGVLLTCVLVIVFFRFGYDVMPRNSLSGCNKQFINTENQAAGAIFCECIHTKGQPLDDCLREFEANTE
jgi:uncharacterized membrane protein YphA (DoxX/SURF4 family)